MRDLIVFLEYFLSNPTEVKPIRRSRSISQSFKNLFRSNSKKKNTVARTDALAEFGNGKQHSSPFSLIRHKKEKKHI